MEKITKKELKSIEKKKLKLADIKWSLEVRNRDGECICCGRKDKLQAHHIVPREIKEYRHELNNGITLCPKCHRFSLKASAHRNPFIFYLVITRKRQEQFKYLVHLLIENGYFNEIDGAISNEK